MRFDHLPLARAPPLRRVFDCVGRVERALAKQVLIHREKPLRRRAENHGIVTAPAMWIGMLVLRRAPQRPARAQIVDDARIGRENVHAGVGAGLGGEPAGRIYRIENRQTVFHSRIEIVGAVPGRSVDYSRPGLQVHVRRENDRRIALHERMAHGESVELFAKYATDERRVREPLAQRALRERLGDDQHLAVHAIEHVGGVGAQCNGYVRRKRPRRRRPDKE